jgi:hypothetical protein
MTIDFKFHYRSLFQEVGNQFEVVLVEFNFHAGIVPQILVSSTFSLGWFVIKTKFFAQPSQLLEGFFALLPCQWA